MDRFFGFITFLFCILVIAANPTPQATPLPPATPSSLAAAAATPPAMCHPGYEPSIIGCIPCNVSSYSKDGQKCLKCAVCHRGHVTFHPCEPNRNAHCVCPPGKYERRGICVLCTTCTPGLVMTRACNHNLDTECKECPKGMTTNSTDSKKCIPKGANDGTVIHIHNTSVTSAINWEIILPLSCIPAFLLLVGLFFVCKCRRKRRERNNNHENNDEDMLMETMPLHFEAEPPERNHREVNQLTSDIYEELGDKLNINTRNNWKTLAGLLGYTKENVCGFELNPKEAVQDMLFDYSTREVSTVYNLHSALVAMNREDAACIVRPFIYT